MTKFNMTGQTGRKGLVQDGRTRSKRARHTLEWLLLRGLMAFVRRGDVASAYTRIHGLSWSLRQLLRSEWRWAHFNLKLVYGPNITEAQCHRLAAMAFENIIRSHVDSMRVEDFQFSESEAEQQLQPLYDAYRQGQGVILGGIHLGTWEVGLKILASVGFPLGVVYRHASNPLSEREFMTARASYGVQWIRRDDPRAIVRALREKKVLTLMSDINQRQGGIPAPFLGVPALCPVGASRLMERFQSPYLPCICLREGPGQVRFHFTPVVKPWMGHDRGEACATMTARINHSFEPWIHTYAEQYNWLHARWRSRPDGALWHINTKQAANTLLATLSAARTTPYPILSERIQRLLA